VRDLSDEDAYMALALCNAQGELSPLEIGIHALGSGMQPKEYADKIGKSRTSLQHNYNAARVALETNIGLSDLDRHWLALDALHPAPRWLWRSLVSRLVAEGWTVEQARGAAQRFKDCIAVQFHPR
jgi:ParB-like chromosome segregation protein Spo0J